MENQTTSAAVQLKTAELIAAKTEKKNSVKAGTIRDGIYSAIADGITDEISAGIYSMKCNDALESRMILNKQSLEQALDFAILQYADIYLPAAEKAEHKPVNFETFLINGVI